MQYARYTPVVHAVLLAIGAIGFSAPALAQTADTTETAKTNDKADAASIVSRRRLRPRR